MSIIGQLEIVTKDTSVETLTDLKDIPTQSIMQNEITEENEEDLENNQAQAQKSPQTEIKSPQVLF